MGDTGACRHSSVYQQGEPLVLEAKHGPVHIHHQFDVWPILKAHCGLVVHAYPDIIDWCYWLFCSDKLLYLLMMLNR